MRVRRTPSLTPMTMPTISACIETRGNHFFDRDYKIAQQFSERSIKLTVPGPLSIIDTTANT